LPSDLGPTGQQDPYQGYGVLYDAALCAFAFLFVVGVVHPRLSRDFMFRLAALPSACCGSKKTAISVQFASGSNSCSTLRAEFPGARLLVPASLLQ